MSNEESNVSRLFYIKLTQRCYELKTSLNSLITRKWQHANCMRWTTRLFSIHAIIFFAAHERRENHRESAANICCFDENEKEIPMRFSRLSFRSKKIIKHGARSLLSPVFSWISDCLEINKKAPWKLENSLFMKRRKFKSWTGFSFVTIKSEKNFKWFFTKCIAWQTIKTFG